MTRIQLPPELSNHAPGIYCLHALGDQTRVSGWNGGDADDIWEDDLRRIRLATHEALPPISVQLVAIDTIGQAWLIDSVELDLG
jgi:hypothetical protein